MPPGIPRETSDGTTLWVVTYAAFAVSALAVVLALGMVWRTIQAAGDRDNQPADSNDVVVAVALATFIVVVALSAVVFAVLS